ncbi:MAG TPA: hypothetical protein VF365_08725 [Candidatus Limnocylindria bacterium]
MIRRLVRAMGFTALGGLAVWGVVAVVAWRVDDATLDLPAVLLLFGQLVIVPLGAMAGLHGTVAAIGVVLCGLLGWRMAQDR